MMRALGYKVDHAGGVVRGAYMSMGFGQQMELQANSMKAMVRIAEASEKSAAAAQEIAARAYGGWYLTAEEALSRNLVAGLV